MPQSGFSKAIIVNGMAKVDKTNPDDLKFFRKGRVIPSSSLGLEETFELFGFTNKSYNTGLIRSLDNPEMKAEPSQHVPPLSLTAKGVLTTFSEIWPQCKESNMRNFVRILTSFAVEQINHEIENANCYVESHKASDEIMKPGHIVSSSRILHSAHQSRILKSQLPGSSQFPGLSEFPVTLKAYTEVSVSWDRATKEGEMVTIKRFINYGISYAAKTPEALETFFVIAETKMVGNMGKREWAQLLSYIGVVQKKRKAAGMQNITVYGLLTDGEEYEFFRMNNRLKVPRSQRFQVAKDLNAIYRVLSQCLRSIIQS
ncbi:hypothetical protein MMC31_000320 [Peltigera leucophlebia]|nr:hypothetical protein [Peltigera leucophlebia]